METETQASKSHRTWPTSCEICLSDKKPVFHYEGPIRYGNVAFRTGVVLRCMNCKTDQLAPDSYLTEKDYKDGTYRAVTKKPKSVLLAALSERLDILSQIDLEDIVTVRDRGCGEGLLVGTLNQLRFHAVGDDVDDTLLMPAHAAVQKHSNRPDLITCLDVLEHVERPEPFMARLCVEGSERTKYLFCCPVRPDTLEPETYYCAQHKWYFTHDSLLNFLKRWFEIELSWLKREHEDPHRYFLCQKKPSQS